MKRPAKRKAKRSPKARKPSDAALINECVIYAQSIAALHSGFKADPDGNSEHAAKLGDKFSNRAWQALTKIASTPAATPEGLCSKARIVALVFQDNEGGCLEADAAGFLKAFAAEVKQFLQPICDGQVKLEADTPERREYREREDRIREVLEGRAA